MSVIEEVKQKLDIVDVVGQYTPLLKSGRNFRAVCPFHQEKTPSFFVFPERQSWHCFGACGAGGDIFSFVMKREGIDFGEALRRLADRAGVPLPSRADDKSREVRGRLHRANHAAAAYFHDLLKDSPLARRAREYLSGRGVNGVAIDSFELGFAADSWDSLKTHMQGLGFTEAELLEAGLLSKSDTRVFDRWRNRLMFPIRDERGNTCGFGARILEPASEGPKYINTPQSAVFDKSGILYGMDLAASEIRQQNQVVIVEGYMDVIAAHQYGHKNVVASMGTSITDKQIAIVKRCSKNLVLALDSDSAGLEAMARCVAHENALESEIRVVSLPPGKDPDDVIKSDGELWTLLIGKAVPVVDFVFDGVTSAIDLNRVSERTKARDRLLPVVAAITDVVRKAHYMQKLAMTLRVSESSLSTSERRQATAARQGGSAIPTERRVQDMVFARPVEEFCLSLLLRFPELRQEGMLLPDVYFQNSENREVFSAWKGGDGSVQSVQGILDPSVHEHLSSVVGRDIRPLEISRKFETCMLRLREEHLRGLERKREALLAGDSDPSTELAKSKEVTAELKQVFELKARREQTLRS